MSSLTKNLAFAFGLAVIVWLGYTVFIKDSESTISVQNAQIANEAVRDSQEFLSRLQQLKDIELSRDLFDDPRFSSLVDLRQSVAPETVGRSNPFAELGEQ